MKKVLETMVALIVVVILTGAFIIVNCAPTGETGKDGHFIAYENGTVLDTKTNLMWAAKDNGSDIKWEEISSYCKNYRGGGYTDWRIPTQDELSGLYDESTGYRFEGGQNVHLTKLIILTSAWLWASETRDGLAAGLNFSIGPNWQLPPFPKNRLPKNFVGNTRILPVRSNK
jgi:hypothetical protein